jgi:hypothetical protein
MNFYLVLSAVLSIAFLFLFGYALVTGKAPSRVGSAKRSENPLIYWFNTAILFAFAAFSIAWFVRCLLELQTTGQVMPP